MYASRIRRQSGHGRNSNIRMCIRSVPDPPTQMSMQIGVPKQPRRHLRALAQIMRDKKRAQENVFSRHRNGGNKPSLVVVDASIDG